MVANKKKMSARKKRAVETSKTHQLPVSALAQDNSRSARRPVAELSSILRAVESFKGAKHLEDVLTRTGKEAFSLSEKSPGQKMGAKVCFVAPVLPHTMVLDIWNKSSISLSLSGVVITSHQEAPIFERYVQTANAQGLGVSLEIVTLDSMDENRTFLAGLEEELTTAAAVVSIGETSLATYQAMKHCRNHRKRLVVWQNAPRPMQTVPTARQNAGLLQPAAARERSVRKEILRTCDVLLCFDKESATLAFLEGVSPQRIRRVPRGVFLERYSEAFRKMNREEIRRALGILEDEIVFLQAGPLEVESGVFDTIFAFKNMLQSQGALQGRVKLVCCGQGSAGADVRQMVVDLGLDESVYFLSHAESSETMIRGDHLSHLVAIADLVVHNPVSPVSGEPMRFLDSTHDLLAAVSYGIPVITNGYGWVGEWLSRFNRSFSPGNIHSQSKMMRDSLEKYERYSVMAASARKALENDLKIETTVAELSRIITELLEDARAIQTNDAQQLFELIERNIQARQYIDAIGAIEKAFSLSNLKPSQQAWLFRTVGDCFTRLGDLESGQQNYLRAADLDPYCPRVYIGLGTVALQAKHYNVAVPQFHKAIALAPKDDMANLGLGLAFEGLGELDQSLKWTVRACELSVENKAAIYHLVKLSYELGQYEEAITAVERYVNRHPYDVHMIYTLGGLLYKCGQTDMAQELMENILRIDPVNNLAHSLLAQITRETKQKMKNAAGA